MGLVSTLLRPQASGDPNDERFWSHGFGQIATSGVVVNPETAMRTSAVFACVRLIATSVAMLPAIVYKRVGETGRRRAYNHPIYDLIHDQPNEWQTSMEFKEMLTGHCLLRGNGYAQIIPGPRGPADQLIPLHPDRVTPERIPGGGIRYKLQLDDGSTQILNHDQVFHLRGMSSDGLKGISVLEMARESFGLAIATEQYGARLFAQNASPGGVLNHPGKLSRNAGTRLKEEWEQAHAGLQNAHRVAVLEEGMTWQQIGMTNEDAQFLATREFQIEDISRWFGVPLHMISSHTRSTSWGSGIEQLSIGFVTYTLMAWLVRWEQTIGRDLITNPGTYFVEFLVDTLLRGNTLDRFNAYQVAVGGNAPWMTRNEVRERENQTPIPGLDDILQPLNMAIPKAKPAEGPGRADETAAPDGTETDDEGTDPSRPGTPEKPGTSAYLRLLVYEAAGRVIRKETVALGKAAKRLADDSEGWRRAVDDFYADHAAFVAEVMKLPPAVAATYVSEQRAALLTYGVAALEGGAEKRTLHLVSLALGEAK